MSAESTLEAIRSKGHWRINFRPLTEDSPITTLRQCFDLVNRNRVSARGWDYPHVPVGAAADRGAGVESLEDSIQAWDSFYYHRELWRMYLSSQFIHLRSIPDDWSDEDPFRMSSQPPPPVLPSKTLGVLANSWTLVEVFLFLSRLANAGLYPTGAEVSIKLVNTAGRTLRMDSNSRVPLYGNYTTHAETLTYEVVLTTGDIAEPTERAIDAIAYFFDKFMWNPARDQLRQLVNELFKP